MGPSLQGIVQIGFLALLLAAPAALADGDPPSDVLYFGNVFLPTPAPRPDAGKALQAQVASVYRHGDRIKVAVIASPSDLGSIPSLFDRPVDYSRFLGLELQSIFIGPLLVVMPTGFGIYDGGRSTSAEEQVLKGVPIEGQTPDDLASTATAAVGRLLAAGALVSRDILAPIVLAIPAAGRFGQPTPLKYTMSDDSGRSSVVLQVLAGQAHVLATLKEPLRDAQGGNIYSLTWRLPLHPPAGALRFCLVATDPSGNRSRQSCASLKAGR